MTGIRAGSTPATLDTLRDHIAAAFPDLADARLVAMTAGWDSLAVNADDRFIFKFPRNSLAAAALVREVGLLAVLAPQLTMRVPAPVLVEGEMLFSRHDIIPGEHLLAEGYQALPDHGRQRLADAMAQFFAQLHEQDVAVMEKAGARPIRKWLDAEDILRRTHAMLPPDLRAFAQACLAAWSDLEPDPHGMTYGFFDGHGWNMAFDHDAQRLNGIYDFADSGFGDLTQEFIYPNWISADLTGRIIAAYETLTGRLIDRQRVDVLSGVLRLTELAEEGHDPALRTALLDNLAAWVSHRAVGGFFGRA
ncbi:hypothetical protein GCM10007276_32310 [Agaricicola taiwanensis]|uniref:Aminoglycoside phosphotransferase domain-containing protein n=1 Tax=Agaricicola taiwanensis TaxID=591372 RepID=A0A8J2YMC4_9RHOB|nr:aminoglycoside phosphotransferase family protein [Agaricicola taiwanensis]GGE52833.1 hypothetical protein GCM10007276_32310 [Agaricicola taiwanensis]